MRLVCNLHFPPALVAKKFNTTSNTVKKTIEKSGKPLPKSFKNVGLQQLAAVTDGLQTGYSFEMLSLLPFLKLPA